MYSPIKLIPLVAALLAGAISLQAQSKTAAPLKVNVYQLNKPGRWADSVFHSLNEDQKIGQLMMATAYSRSDRSRVGKMEELITDYHIGGLMFAQGGPERQINLLNDYQSLSNVPLLIAMDAEWGLGMRLDSTRSYPRQMQLGAIQNDELIYNFGREVAQELRRVGAQATFSPVVDVNSNQWNPVIGTRAFGSDPQQVSRRSAAYMKGLQDGGVLAFAKHFPGHGDTDQDSHKVLPALFRSKETMNRVELYPYKQLIPQGLTGVMTGHINVPAYDESGDPASQSFAICTTLLKRELGFTGLVITDDLIMRGAAGDYSSTEAAVRSLIAGNDILLNPENIPSTIYGIRGAIASGRISWLDIDEKVKKILAAKEAVGLNRKTPPVARTVIQDLESPAAKALNRELVKNSLTLVLDRQHLVPIQDLDKTKIAALSIGSYLDNTFLKTLARYAPLKQEAVWMEDSEESYRRVEENLSGAGIVIIGLHSIDVHAKNNFGISQRARDLIHNLSLKTKVILTIFGTPYSMSNFDYVNTILLAYDDSGIAQSLSAQALFGGVALSGKLPADVGEGFKEGQGVETKKIRIEYALPESVGMKSSALDGIDRIAKEGIEIGAYPGCVIMVLKDSKVIYEKAFGHHTYDKTQAEKTDNVFDLASITKIAATTQGVMRLYEQGRIDLDKPFETYAPVARGTDKASIPIKDFLMHQAGLTPFIPFYKRIAPADHSPDSNATYPTRVADHYFIRKDYYKDVMLPEMLHSKLGTPGKYVYSDISLYFMQEVLQDVTGQHLENYVAQNFYQPLGLTTMGFNPRNHLPLDRLIPTENDQLFRGQLLLGDVHDQGAAMCGGVAGHAGLFSNANDLAVLMQMLLNDGEYGGQRYFKPETVKKFTSYQNPSISRRGLGFDKPNVSHSERSTARNVSDATFGHTGFTGTCVWSDPENQLTFIFLSNRVCPSAENTKLGNIRTEIHQTIYDAL